MQRIFKWKARKIGLLELTFYVFSRILNLQIHAHIYRSFVRHHKMLGVRIAKTENRASKARKPLRHKTLLLHLFCQHTPEDLYILDILSAMLRVSGGLGLLFFQILQFLWKLFLAFFAVRVDSNLWLGANRRVLSPGVHFEQWKSCWFFRKNYTNIWAFYCSVCLLQWAKRALHTIRATPPKHFEMLRYFY